MSQVSLTWPCSCCSGWDLLPRQQKASLGVRQTLFLLRDRGSHITTIKGSWNIHDYINIIQSTNDEHVDGRLSLFHWINTDSSIKQQSIEIFTLSTSTLKTIFKHRTGVKVPFLFSGVSAGHLTVAPTAGLLDKTQTRQQIQPEPTEHWIRPRAPSWACTWTFWWDWAKSLE